MKFKCINYGILEVHSRIPKYITYFVCLLSQPAVISHCPINSHQQTQQAVIKINIYVPYSRKSSNKLFFKNCQAFSKIFFQNVFVMVTCSFKFQKMALLKYFKHIEPSKEEEIQRCAAITRWYAANSAIREILTNNPIDEDSPSPCNKIMLKAVHGTY